MCPSCETKFQFAPIDDSRAQERLLPPKPLFPIIGLEIECPHCGHRAAYQRTELTYEA
jgi:rubredoxin